MAALTFTLSYDIDESGEARPLYRALFRIVIAKTSPAGTGDTWSGDQTIGPIGKIGLMRIERAFLTEPLIFTVVDDAATPTETKVMPILYRPDPWTLKLGIRGSAFGTPSWTSSPLVDGFKGPNDSTTQQSITLYGIAFGRLG